MSRLQMRTIGRTPVYIAEAGKEKSEKLIKMLENKGHFQGCGRYAEVKVEDGVAALTDNFSSNFGTTKTTYQVGLNERGELIDLPTTSTYHRVPSKDDPRQIDSLWTANPITGEAHSHCVVSEHGKKTEETTRKMANQKSSDLFYYLGQNDYSNLVKDYRSNKYCKTIADPTGKRGVAVEFGTITNVDGKEVLTRKMGGSIHPELGKIGKLDETLEELRKYPNTIGYQLINGMTGHQGRILKTLG